jgi:hypothetical protein
MKTHENPNRQPTRVEAIALPAAAQDNISLHKTEKPAEEQPPTESRNKERRNQLLLLAVSIAVVGLLGALVWDFILQIEEDKAAGQFKGTEHNAVLAITVFIQAMIAFFGILNLEEPHRTKVSPVTKGGMRSAITGALVVTYLFLVIFHCVVEFTGGTSSTTGSFVNNFTWIVGFTVAFYFASEAGLHLINSFKPEPKPHQTRPNGSTSEPG